LTKKISDGQRKTSVACDNLAPPRPRDFHATIHRSEERMSKTPHPDDEAQRFRRRLFVLAVIAVLGLAALSARLVWLQAMQ
jgi:hypothetical protein